MSLNNLQHLIQEEVERILSEVREENLEDWGASGDFGTKNPIWDMGEDGIKIKSKLPKYLYHGNAFSKAQGISENGNDGSIHLTANPEYAKSFAAMTAEEDYEDRPEEAGPAALLQIDTSALEREYMDEPDNLDDVNTITYKEKIPPGAIELVATAEPSDSPEEKERENEDLWSYVEELAEKHTPYMYDYIGGAPRGSGPSELADYLMNQSNYLKSLMKDSNLSKKEVWEALADAIKRNM